MKYIYMFFLIRWFSLSCLYNLKIIINFLKFVRIIYICYMKLNSKYVGKMNLGINILNEL